MQATKAGCALRLCPDGKAVAHLNRRHGAALGTQAAADAAIGIDGKQLVCCMRGSPIA